MMDTMRGQANIVILFIIVTVLIFAGSTIFKAQLQQLALRTENGPEITVGANGLSGGSEPSVQGPTSEPPAGTTGSVSGGGEAVTPPAEREGAVYISGVSRSSDGLSARVTLRTKLNAGERVNVTGWMLQTNERRLYLPEAVRMYQVDGVNTEGDIVLEPGTYLTLYAGSMSPIGYNFRVNKCMGYLNERYDMSLPNECPLPTRDATYQTLAGWCQNYIRSLSRCELPDPAVTNEWRGEEGNACREFVYGFFTIDHCYESFSGDEILDNEWRVWVNASEVFDPRHDWVRLINAKGDVIDSYVY